MEESSQKGRFIRPLQGMLNSDSPAVAFESATTLVTLSSAPSAVKASANTLLSLLTSQTDNNIKIVILERLSVIIKHNCRLLEDSVMELLSLLKTPSTEIRSTILDLMKLLVSERNINEVSDLPVMYKKILNLIHFAGIINKYSSEIFEKKLYVDNKTTNYSLQ